METQEQLPAEALEYIKEVNNQNPQADLSGEIQAAKDSTLIYCNDFVEKSRAWRDSSYRLKWEKYQRMCDGIFEPSIEAAKADWQSKCHVPITASHRESIHAYLFRAMVGNDKPLEVKPRYPLGDQDQSENIEGIVLREMDKARWEVEYDGALHDADTYGSGFLRRYWETKVEKRKLKKPVMEGFTDNLNPMGMMGYAKRAMTNQLKVVGYEEQEQDVLIYRGLKIQHISIWDVFKTPNIKKIPGSTIAIRYWLKYGDIVKGAAEGYYLPEAVEKLKGLASERKATEGSDTIKADRDVIDTPVPTPDYGKEFECFELFGRLPKKWIYKSMGQTYDGDGEELVPARVCFHKLCPIAIEINEEYDGEPAIHQLDYFPKTNDAYGLGVPEMLETPQTVANEIVNQRLDNGAIALNLSFGVIEKALVNPKQDLKSKPGQVIRFDAKYVPNGDVRNVLSQMQITDTPLRAGFSEVNEWERFAQERTSANRVTLGTAGLVKDANQTLGGQELLRQSAGEKFAYIGLMQELSFTQDFFHGVWKTVYRNIDPDDVVDALGEEKAATFVPITPEEVSRDYIYKPLGVFGMESKAIRQARLTQIRQQFLGAPWIDDEKFFDAICRAAEEDAELFKKDEQAILDQQAGMINPGGEVPGMGGPEQMPGNPGVEQQGQQTLNAPPPGMV